MPNKLNSFRNNRSKNYKQSIHLPAPLSDVTRLALDLSENQRNLQSCNAYQFHVRTPSRMERRANLPIMYAC